MKCNLFIKIVFILFLGIIFYYNQLSSETFGEICQEIKEYEIDINKKYIILFDNNVINYKNVTPRIIKLEKITTLNNDKNLFIFYAKEKGEGKLDFEFENNKKFEYVIKISEKPKKYNKTENDIIFEIDKPYGFIPQDGLMDMELDNIWMKY